MKRIYLMRHGKAEDGFDKSDFERDLIAKGIKKTEKVIQTLVKKNLKPDLILVSLAHRTVQTAQAVQRVLNIDPNIIMEEKGLYLAASNSILDVIYAVNDEINDLMIIGHNPGLSTLATYLSKQDIDWMPTSSIVAIEMNVEKWNEIPSSKVKLLFYAKAGSL